MGHTNDRSTKASSLVNPTSLNLQPRPFAPLESDEKEEAVSRKSGYPENFLEKIINTPSSESATPVQRKSGNRLKAITTERTNTAIQNQPIQRQEAVEEEKSEGEQEEGKEFTMNPEPPPVQRKFENRLRAKNAQRMAIQAKLAIGEPNDKYEQEADATAARVVQQINSPTTSQSQPVQRKFENRLRAKNAQRMEIQAKLAIGEPNDKYELEADATAARVVQQINSSITSQSQPVQRQELEEDEELQMKPLVQRSENLGGDEASTDLESAIQSARGSGQSLDANLQESMGQAMGADFSGVKVHTDSQSDQLNKSIQAKAFTTGQDLFFRQGAYEPSSRGGQELIAHELTHVVQQNGGAVQRSPLIAKTLTETSALSSPIDADKVIQAQEDHYIQTKRTVDTSDAPPSSYRGFIDKDKLESETYAAYAERHYGVNRARALTIIKSIVEKLKTDKGKVGATEDYVKPDPEQWEVIPALKKEEGINIRGFGVKVEYNHKKLWFDESASKKVGYQTQFKRNDSSGKIELLAAANYAPTATQKGSSDDPHLKMNLNQIWASQLDYFTLLEAAAKNYKHQGKPKKLHQVKRSKVENWSSLATYWITNGYGTGGNVDDIDDWLALSGSPNGNALLWLILQNPELGEALDAETIEADVKSLYALDIQDEGPYFLFH